MTIVTFLHVSAGHGKVNQIKNFENALDKLLRCIKVDNLTLSRL